MLADSSTIGFALIDGKSILGTLTDIKDPGMEWETRDHLFLGENLRHAALNGIGKCDIEQTGVFDDAVAGIHNALKTPSKGRVFAWAPFGNTTGKRVECAQVDQVSYNDNDIQGGEFVTATAKYSATKHDSGLIIAHLAARGAAGNTEATYVDCLDASTLGGVGYLELTALTLGGYTDVVVKVRHSPDHAAWADLMTFTAKTVIGAERKTVATNPIERYLAISWAYTGAGAGPSCTLAVGFCRNV